MAGMSDRTRVSIVPVCSKKRAHKKRRENGERGSSDECRLRAEPVPQQACHDVRSEHGEPDEKIEDAEGRSAQRRRRMLCDQLGQ